MQSIIALCLPSLITIDFSFAISRSLYDLSLGNARRDSSKTSIIFFQTTIICIEKGNSIVNTGKFYASYRFHSI